MRSPATAKKQQKDDISGTESRKKKTTKQRGKSISRKESAHPRWDSIGGTSGRTRRQAARLRSSSWVKVTSPELSRGNLGFHRLGFSGGARPRPTPICRHSGCRSWGSSVVIKVWIRVIDATFTSTSVILLDGRAAHWRGRYWVHEGPYGTQVGVKELCDRNFKLDPESSGESARGSTRPQQPSWWTEWDPLLQPISPIMSGS